MLNPGYDNEMDEASREAAGKYTPPGEPNWQKMQDELDRVLPVQPAKRRTPFLLWALPLLLLVGGGGYWLLQTKQGAVVPVKTAPVTDAAAINPQASSKAITTAVPNNIEAEKNTIVERDIQKPAKRIISANRIISSQNNKKAFSPAADHTAKAKLPVPGNEMRDKQIPGQQIVNATENPGQKPVAAETKSNTAILKETSQLTKEESIGTKPVQTKTSEQAVTNEPTTELPVTVVARAEIRTSKGRGWSYALLAGVDKSTVKFRYNNDPGYNLGLMAGYHFNDKLSLHTGAIYTQKNYKMAGEDFTAPKGTWPSYYKLENVTGYCRMWEVPLLMRYTISNRGKNSIYLSTGLSSYFMTSENYNYFFYSTNQPVTRNAAYPSSDTHIMSILHLSAGFESQVTRTLSLQIEPYAKIPLDRVGLGNISLSSFGLNFSLQRRQPSKK
jgi:hypothetical protein